MTKEEKQLVIKDLAARLPYNVIVYNTRPVDVAISFMEMLMPKLLGEFMGDDTFELRPYLRPMSSMTQEELKEFTAFTSLSFHRFICDATNTDHWYNTYEEEDWLDAHHFDYRHLIERGLAYSALPGMYTIKTGHK